MAAKLSYVITTYNKLPYLKEVMRLLLLNKKEDEEIIIADGGSSDGTPAFLQELFSAGKIDRFVSERDRGEAHGFNKVMLMATGSLIKILSDDDVYDYAAIAACRLFMEDNERFDVLVGNSGTAGTEKLSAPFLNPEMQQEFEKWVAGTNKTFYCNGLSLMIRKSSLPLLGLFNTNFLCVDLEYTIRTGRIADYAFAKQFVVTRIVNPSSNGDRFAERCEQEKKQLCATYDYPVPPTWQGHSSTEIKRSAWWRFKNYFNSMLKHKQQEVAVQTADESPVEKPSLEEVYAFQLQQLQKLNSGISPEFLRK